MRVVYRVKRGNKYLRETVRYADLEAANRGILERVRDPFSPEVVGIIEIRDEHGRQYHLEWSAIMIPTTAIAQAA